MKEKKIQKKYEEEFKRQSKHSLDLLKHLNEAKQRFGIKVSPHFDPPSARQHHFQSTERLSISIPALAGQIHGNQPIALCFSLVQASFLKLALQRPQRQIMFATKLVLSFCRNPLNSNSIISRWTSSRLRRLRPETSWLSLIPTSQH